MKKLFFTLLIFQISIFSQNNKLNSFEELLTELKNGKTVKVVVNYEKTKLVIDGKEEIAPKAIGGFEINSFEYFAKGVVRNEKSFVSISESVLIYHPRYNYVINYVKMRIYDDNSVEITARYLDPKSYEVKMDETFHSEIDNGANDKAVIFFTKD